MTKITPKMASDIETLLREQFAEHGLRLGPDVGEDHQHTWVESARGTKLRCSSCGMTIKAKT